MKTTDMRSGLPYPVAEARARDELPPGGSAALILGAPVWLAYAAYLAVRRHPLGSVLVTTSALVLILTGPVPVLVGYGSLAIVLGLWCVTDRPTFERVTRGARVMIRARRYRARWRGAVRAAELAEPVTGWLPTLLRVSAPTVHTDRLHVRPILGQTSPLWLDRADQLARSLGGHRLTVRIGSSGTLWLDLSHALARPDRPGRHARERVERPSVGRTAPQTGRAEPVEPDLPTYEWSDRAEQDHSEPVAAIAATRPTLARGEIER